MYLPTSVSVFYSVCLVRWDGGSYHQGFIPGTSLYRRVRITRVLFLELVSIGIGWPKGKGFTSCQWSESDLFSFATTLCVEGCNVSCICIVNFVFVSLQVVFLTYYLFFMMLFAYLFQFSAIVFSLFRPWISCWSFCTSIRVGICFINLDFRNDIFGMVFMSLHFHSVDLASRSSVLSML